MGSELGQVSTVPTILLAEFRFRLIGTCTYTDRGMWYLYASSSLSIARLLHVLYRSKRVLPLYQKCKAFPTQIVLGSPWSGSIGGDELKAVALAVSLARAEPALR
jgi:hypothetical protein